MITTQGFSYSFAHKETGIFNGVHLTVSDPAVVALNTPADHVAVPGHHDHLSKRLDVERLTREDSDALTAWDGTGQRPAPPQVTAAHVVDHQPPAPSADHEWNAATRRWQLSEAAQAKAATHAAAVARIGALRDSQHDLVRRLLLGDESARAALRSIEDEITGLAVS